MTIDVSDDTLSPFGISIYSDDAKLVAQDILLTLDGIQYSLAVDAMSCALEALGKNSKVVIE